MDNVVANEHVQVLIPPDAGKRDTPHPGWDGGRYTSMRQVLATDYGGGLYRRRKVMVESVFAQTKHNRRINQFQRRGRSAARSEWRLITATHNLLKLHKHQIALAAALKATPAATGRHLRPDHTRHRPGNRRHQPRPPPRPQPFTRHPRPDAGDGRSSRWNQADPVRVTGTATSPFGQELNSSAAGRGRRRGPALIITTPLPPPRRSRTNGCSNSPIALIAASVTARSPRRIRNASSSVRCEPSWS